MTEDALDIILVLFRQIEEVILELHHVSAWVRDDGERHVMDAVITSGETRLAAMKRSIIQ